MSESDEGESVAATRQNAGRRLNCCSAAGLIPGRANPPAGTTSEKVIEVPASARRDKLSHDAAGLRACPYTNVPSSTAHSPPVIILIAPSHEVVTRCRRTLDPGTAAKSLLEVLN